MQGILVYMVDHYFSMQVIEVFPKQLCSQHNDISWLAGITNGKGGYFPSSCVEFRDPNNCKLNGQFSQASQSRHNECMIKENKSSLSHVHA